MEINSDTIEMIKERLDAYVLIESPFSKGFTPKTHLLDILYLIGVSIDEKKYSSASGFDELKKELLKAIEAK